MKTVKEILIDTSSSMADMLNGKKRKIDLAKEILLDKILPHISSADKVSIRLFGGSCAMVGALENIPKGEFKLLRDFILNDIPEPKGSTPLALAITTAVDNLKNEPKAEREIYLVTDGQETCGGNVNSAADYAASNGIRCKIHIISIGDLTAGAKAQFDYLTHCTGGKNLNLTATANNALWFDKEIESFLSPHPSYDEVALQIKRNNPEAFQNLMQLDLDSFCNTIDIDFIGNKAHYRKSEILSIRDFVQYTKSEVNYIPGLEGATCQKLLIVEFYNDDKGLTNLIEALQHVENCGIQNKEVLILMNKWDDDYYDHYFKSWVKQFKSKGVERVCMKLDGFKSYKEL